jgi:hypothetical protein
MIGSLSGQAIEIRVGGDCIKVVEKEEDEPVALKDETVVYTI